MQLGSAKLPSCAFIGCNICRRIKFPSCCCAPGRKVSILACWTLGLVSSPGQLKASVSQRSANCQLPSSQRTLPLQDTSPSLWLCRLQTAYIIHISVISRPFKVEFFYFWAADRSHILQIKWKFISWVGKLLLRRRCLNNHWEALAPSMFSLYLRSLLKNRIEGASTSQ